MTISESRRCIGSFSVADFGGVLTGAESADFPDDGSLSFNSLCGMDFAIFCGVLSVGGIFDEQPTHNKMTLVAISVNFMGGSGFN